MKFYIVDVFGLKKYSGNQLAVIVLENEISTDKMQQIANEFHFSETTFINLKKSKKNEFDVRIFTPYNEIPFAGHPTLGTAYIINNMILDNPVDKIILKLKAGKIPVVFKENDLCWMEQIEPVFGELHSAGDAAKLLNLRKEDIDNNFPIQNVSTGIDFMIIPLKTLGAVKSANVNLEYYKKYFSINEEKPLYIFCSETYDKINDINCRMFADIFGIPEDPATGSANGCLAGYLLKYNYFNGEEIDVKVEQGFEIGRESILHLKSFYENDKIKIKVGGKVFKIAEGKLL
jgi:trans-2,3-dihydro-3-hydroxyanthranilate isomerase